MVVPESVFGLTALSMICYSKTRSCTLTKIYKLVFSAKLVISELVVVGEHFYVAANS
jgi:hypothetical protein